MSEITCRICLTEKSDFGGKWSSVFEKISQKTVLQIMMECTNLEISKNDFLPKTICCTCFENIKLVNAFRDLIIESDFILRKKCLNFRQKTNKCEDHKSFDSIIDVVRNTTGTIIEIKNVNDDEETKNIESKEALSSILELNLDIKMENNKIEEVDSLQNKELGPLDSKLFDDKNTKMDLDFYQVSHQPDMSNKIKEDAGEIDKIKNSILNDLQNRKIKSRGSSKLYKLKKSKKTKGKTASLKHKKKNKLLKNYETPGKQDTQSNHIKKEGKDFILNLAEENIDNSDITDVQDDIDDEFSPVEDCDDPDLSDQEKCLERNKNKGQSKKKNHRSQMGKAKCLICNHVSINKYVLRQHIRLKHEMDNGKKPYCCDQCPKRYINNYQLKVHQNSHTGAKPYPCDMCDRKFKSPTAARLHKQLQHIADKKWKCFDCQKGFISQHMLQNHVRQVHTKERPFLCEICSKGFAAKGMLTTHIKSVHVRETEPCPVCKKEYNIFSMKVHLLSHQGVKNHVCETCGNAFTTKGSLKAHKFIHTGEKPNVCQICGKGFIQKQSLKKHIMSHSDLRPFLCNLCNETYKYRQDLIRHMKKHQKEQEK